MAPESVVDKNILINFVLIDIGSDFHITYVINFTL